MERSAYLMTDNVNRDLKSVPFSRAEFLRATAALVAATALAACGPAAGEPAALGGKDDNSSPGSVIGGAGLFRPSVPTGTPVPKLPSFLHARGSKIVDADGKEVLLTGLNWFGMETGTYAPHGVWARNWLEMIDQIGELGYNIIRLPFSNAILDPNSRPLEGVDFRKNPDLIGLNGLLIMDKIVEAAGKRGIKILLDRHRPTPVAQSKLWYTEEVPEDVWIRDWTMLAARYRGNDTIVGADIHNEPAGDATWGTGNEKTDWRLAAERCGNAILEVNPDWLIVVEGIEKYESDWYWMGGSLQGARTNPVRLSRPEKLVYSAHDYGPGVFKQGWFGAKEFPANMPAIWDAHWGYLVKENIAPVIVTEFGGRSVGADTEGIWQCRLVEYMKENRIGYTYWCFNPNSGDTGGLLDEDWTTVIGPKQELLASHQAPRQPVNNASAIDLKVAADARKKPLPEQQIKAMFKTNKPEATADEATIEVRIANLSASRIPVENLAFSYWFAAPGIAADGQVLSVDWASVDSKLMDIVLVADQRAGQTHRIDVSFKIDAGMIEPWGNAEIKLRLKRADRGLYSQADAFSFKPLASYGDNDHIPVYFWGQRVWGSEPKS